MTRQDRGDRPKTVLEDTGSDNPAVYLQANLPLVVDTFAVNALRRDLEGYSAAFSTLVTSLTTAAKVEGLSADSPELIMHFEACDQVLAETFSRLWTWLMTHDDFCIAWQYFERERVSLRDPLSWMAGTDLVPPINKLSFLYAVSNGIRQKVEVGKPVQDVPDDISNLAERLRARLRINKNYKNKGLLAHLDAVIKSSGRRHLPRTTKPKKPTRIVAETIGTSLLLCFEFHSGDGRPAVRSVKRLLRLVGLDSPAATTTWLKELVNS